MTRSDDHQRLGPPLPDLLTVTPIALVAYHTAYFLWLFCVVSLIFVAVLGPGIHF